MVAPYVTRAEHGGERRSCDRGPGSRCHPEGDVLAAAPLDPLRAPDIPRVEVDPAAPRALTSPQLRAVERETDRLASSRDRAIMQVLLRTGLRIGEVAALDVQDVRLTQRTAELVVRHGKGDRRRVLPLTRTARAALREWLVDRATHPSRPSRQGGALWLSRTGQQLSVRSINKLVAQIMAAAGVEESATPCVIRWLHGSYTTTARTSLWSPTCSATPTSRPPVATRALTSRPGAPPSKPSIADTARRRQLPGGRAATDRGGGWLTPSRHADGHLFR